MRMIKKQAAKLEELEARRERLVNRVAKLDLKIEEQKEKIVQYYGQQGINVLKVNMSKYTAKQIAESDELFEKQIHKVRKFYLSRNPDKMMMLEERKAVIKEQNKGLSPEYDKEYYCGTCGAKDGAEHPKSGYCFHCDTDNWISKNN